MKEKNNIDTLFKEKINNVSKIPFKTAWSVSKGWKEYIDTHKNKRIFSLSYLKYAAIIAFTIGITILLTQMIENINPQHVEIQTGEGDKTQITFADGSKVWLNANSNIKYPKKLNKKNRTIYIMGEAFFELSEEQEDPLIIVAENTIAQVKESAFNIKTDEENSQVIITVAKGELKVIEDMGTTPVMTTSQGEKTTIFPKHDFLFKEENDDKNYLAWKTGSLNFNNVPLSYVIEKIEEIYGVEIEITNQYINYCRFSHSFQTESVDEILKIITKHLNVQYKRKGNQITLYGTEC